MVIRIHNHVTVVIYITRKRNRAHCPFLAQSAAVLVLEPIFEADLPQEQYAYRADRSALDAVKYVHKLINTGHGEIVDADLSSYLDHVP